MSPSIESLDALKDYKVIKVEDRTITFRQNEEDETAVSLGLKEYGTLRGEYFQNLNGDLHPEKDKVLIMISYIDVELLKNKLL